MINCDWCAEAVAIGMEPPNCNECPIMKMAMEEYGIIPDELEECKNCEFEFCDAKCWTNDKCPYSYGFTID